MNEDKGTNTIKMKEKNVNLRYDISFNISTKEYEKNKVKCLKFENVISN